MDLLLFAICFCRQYKLEQQPVMISKQRSVISKITEMMTWALIHYSMYMYTLHYTYNSNTHTMSS